MIMRMRFVWWPFHPLGYALQSDWVTHQFWMPLLISSVIKWAILKFGGLKVYRKAIPVFLGFILGDLIVGSIWYMIAFIVEKDLYVYFYWVFSLGACKIWEEHKIKSRFPKRLPPSAPGPWVKSCLNRSAYRQVCWKITREMLLLWTVTGSNMSILDWFHYGHPRWTPCRRHQSCPNSASIAVADGSLWAMKNPSNPELALKAVFGMDMAIRGIISTQSHWMVGASGSWLRVIFWVTKMRGRNTRWRPSSTTPLLLFNHIIYLDIPFFTFLWIYIATSYTFVLGLACLLEPDKIAIISLIGIIFLVSFRRKRYKRLPQRLSALFSSLRHFRPAPFDILLIFLSIIELTRIAFHVWYIPPYVWDTLTYHLPNVAEWVQKARIYTIKAATARTNWPMTFEVFETWFAVFLHHDILIQLASG